MVDQAKTIPDVTAWYDVLSHFNQPHILQSWQWARQKEKFGWSMLPTAWYAGNHQTPGSAGMVLKRGLSFGPVRLPFHILYVPRGPLADWADGSQRERVIDNLERLAKAQKCISIKIDPEVPLGTGIPGREDEQINVDGLALQELLTQHEWGYSPAQVQFRNTVHVDLTTSEDSWLARMKQKTRYNVRLAERKGITVREGTAQDIPMLYRMYVETSLRDGFVIRSEEYYRSLWTSFVQQGLAHLLIAEYAGEAVAGLILFCFGRKAWYFYGMSTGLHTEKMPTYLIQWRAMQKAGALGCTVYDMWGAPEHFDPSDS
ncbi:MAG: peptidoglycan bridge formation glycyltransferase FemA/FemB family protein, partial [Anaerolineaceae bacterium]